MYASSAVLGEFSPTKDIKTSIGGYNSSARYVLSSKFLSCTAHAVRMFQHSGRLTIRCSVASRVTSWTTVASHRAEPTFSLAIRDEASMLTVIDHETMAELKREQNAMEVGEVMITKMSYLGLNRPCRSRLGMSQHDHDVSRFCIATSPIVPLEEEPSLLSKCLTFGLMQM